jgi:hypothetical protein
MGLVLVRDQLSTKNKKMKYSHPIFIYLNPHHTHAYTITNKPFTDIMMLPAILILADSKTFGRHPKNGKLLCRAILNQEYIPPNSEDEPITALLVPWVNPTTFVKVYSNKFILVTPTLLKTHKHLIGEITETIGDVDTLANCYRYEMLCKNMAIPTFKPPRLSSPSSPSPPPTILLPLPHIITIDGEHTTDRDDGFRIEVINNDDMPPDYVVHVHITNAPHIIKQHGIDIAKCQRATTLYLPPDSTTSATPATPAHIGMLPSAIEDLCGLTKGREVETVDFAFEVSGSGNPAFGGVVRSVRHFTQKVVVAQNYVYESDEMNANPQYKLLYDVTQLVLNHPSNHMKFPFITTAIDAPSNRLSSENVVAIWMLISNYYAAQHLWALKLNGYNNGIFRRTTSIDTTAASATAPQKPDIRTLPLFVQSDIRGMYSTEPGPHTALGVDCYAHVTSPIRRMADMVNLDILSSTTTFAATTDSLWYNFWITEPGIAELNRQMWNAKKVQNYCNLLYEIHKHEHCTYAGILVEPISPQKWSIYLPKLKIFTKITISPLPLYTTTPPYIPIPGDEITCKLHLFKDKSTAKQKLRLSIIDANTTNTTTTTR